jgi:hypothetical protein
VVSELRRGLRGVRVLGLTTAAGLKQETDEMVSAARLRQMADRRLRLISEGRCAVCSKRARAGRTLCTKCRDRQYERNRRHYERLVSVGKCVRCREENEDAGEFTICRSCRLTAHCKQCGKAKPESRKAFCDTCGKQRLRESCDRTKEKLKASGRCIRCGDEPAPGRASCEACLAKQRAAMARLNSRRRRQKS